jgi:hypothetical protein
VARTAQQLERYAEAWQESNAQALPAEGPLWVVFGNSTAQARASSYDRGWVGLDLLPSAGPLPVGGPPRVEESLS